MTVAAPAQSTPLRLTLGQAFLPLFYHQDPFVLVESPRGCLKTCSILDIVMFRAYRWAGKRWYIWRSTRTLLSTTVLASLEEYVLPRWSAVRGMRCINLGARPDNRTEYIFENGSVILPVGLDDIQRGTSAEGAGGYLAEAVELQNADQATALVGMMRQPGVPFHQILVDTNPGPPGHWLNQIAESIPAGLRRVVTRADYDRLQEYNATPASNPTRRWKRIVAKIQDNPHYFDVEAWQLTDAGRKYLQGLGTLTGHLHARWVEGLWRAAEGAVFKDFDEDVHRCRDFSAGVIQQRWPCYVAEDPGYDHPTAILLCAVAPNERKYFVREFVERQTKVEEDSAAIADWSREGFNIVRKVGDPHYMFNATKLGNGETVAQQMRKLGHEFERAPAANGPADLDSQVQKMRSGLTTMIEGEPEIQVFDTCPKLINAWQSWQHKRSTTGEVTGKTDQYEEKYKDEMDAARMIIVSNPTFAQAEIKVYNNT